MTSGVPRFYDGKSKECGDCFKILPVSEFSLTSEWSGHEVDGELPASAYRSKCKKCKSRYCMNYQKRKKLESFPGLYWECDGCDDLNNKRNETCTKCGDKKPTEFQ
jgi:hypothetical protein